MFHDYLAVSMFSSSSYFACWTPSRALLSFFFSFFLSSSSSVCILGVIVNFFFPKLLQTFKSFTMCRVKVLVLFWGMIFCVLLSWMEGDTAFLAEPLIWLFFLCILHVIFTWTTVWMKQIIRIIKQKKLSGKIVFKFLSWFFFCATRYNTLTHYHSCLEITG